MIAEIRLWSPHSDTHTCAHISCYVTIYIILYCYFILLCTIILYSWTLRFEFHITVSSLKICCTQAMVCRWIVPEARSSWTFAKYHETYFARLHPQSFWFCRFGDESSNLYFTYISRCLSYHKSKFTALIDLTFSELTFLHIHHSWICHLPHSLSPKFLIKVGIVARENQLKRSTGF